MAIKTEPADGLDQFVRLAQGLLVFQLLKHHRQLRMAALKQAAQGRALVQAPVQQAFV